MNDLENFVHRKDHRPISKHCHFFPLYDSLLTKYRNKKVSLLEIGINYGGSLEMWREYLGKEAKIYGIDKVKSTKIEGEQIQCFIGSQSDSKFLDEVIRETGKLDIVIDDGSHFSKDQIFSFQYFFPRLKSGGLYFCEDTHTSYRELYQGGYKKPDTMIEYCKGLVDSLYYRENASIFSDSLTKSIDYILFLFALTVIKKKGISENE